jgi:hypothetical protein
MGQHMANVDAAEIIAYIDAQPVFVAPNIKHRPPLPEETCRGKILTDCRGTTLVLQPAHCQPGWQWAFSVGMGMPKLLQPLPCNNVHLLLFWTYGEKDERVSRLLCQCIGYKRLPPRVNSFASAALCLALGHGRLEIHIDALLMTEIIGNSAIDFLKREDGKGLYDRFKRIALPEAPDDGAESHTYPCHPGHLALAFYIRPIWHGYRPFQCRRFSMIVSAHYT